MLKKQLRTRPVPAVDWSGSTLPPVLCDVLAARGVVSPSELNYQLSQLHPPATLSGLKAAVERLLRARENNEKIIIVGDYDVDGATSVALIILAFRQLGFTNVSYAIPDRFEFGYGLSLKMAEHVANSAPKLVLTVDNGIASHEGIDFLQAKGCDVVVTDHHLAGDTLPTACAIVNPNQPGCAFPSKALAGVGVAFYTVLALRRALLDGNLMTPSDSNLTHLLDLVALGTVADLVPLDRNNRILVAQGISRMRAGYARPGIQALLEVGQKSASRLVSQDLGFSIGPRLNAAGRLQDIATGIECLLADDLSHARVLALELDGINQTRKEIEQSMQQQALAYVASLSASDLEKSRFATVLYQADWHEGVVGLVASRVKDKTGLPTVVFAQSESGVLKGSARSISGVHIRDVLAAVAATSPQLIQQFGGHAMAAGLSLSAEHLPAFRSEFNRQVAHVLGGKPASHSIDTDGVLTADVMTLELADALRTLSPWGQGFPQPVFEGVFTVLNQRIVGGIHLKLTLQVADSETVIDAIAFRFLSAPGTADRINRLRCVYQLDVNEYRGKRTPQLIIDYLDILK